MEYSVDHLRGPGSDLDVQDVQVLYVVPNFEFPNSNSQFRSEFSTWLAVNLVDVGTSCTCTSTKFRAIAVLQLLHSTLVNSEVLVLRY